MENEKLLSMLGLCKKAGQLLQGYTAVTEAAYRGEAVMVLVANDIARGTRSKTRSAAQANEIDYYDIDVSIQELGDRLGKLAGVIGITDRNFARGIKKIIAT